MRRAYSIRPYSIGVFPAVYDHNLGASSHPINPGSNHDILGNHPTNNLKCPLIDHF